MTCTSFACNTFKRASSIAPGDFIVSKPLYDPILYAVDGETWLEGCIKEDDIMFVVWVNDFYAYVLLRGMLGRVNVMTVRRMMF